jgi:hypothetical protein
MMAIINDYAEACRRYMRFLGLYDCEAVRAELSDVLQIPRKDINFLSRIGELGFLAAGAFVADRFEGCA